MLISAGQWTEFFARLWLRCHGFSWTRRRCRNWRKRLLRKMRDER